jgi:D-erythro-7,8-dihydroneopterin triphosphate epimerase
VSRPREEADMSDRILIKNLLVRGILGIKQEEREKLQDILINLELVADLRPAGLSDAIDDAVNYRSVTKDVIALVETSRFHTVEKLATEIARLAVTDYPVREITVRVEKPGALRFAESVGVELTRGAADFAV